MIITIGFCVHFQSLGDSLRRFASVGVGEQCRDSADGSDAAARASPSLIGSEDAGRQQREQGAAEKRLIDDKWEKTVLRDVVHQEGDDGERNAESNHGCHESLGQTVDTRLMKARPELVQPASEDGRHG